MSRTGIASGKRALLSPLLGASAALLAFPGAVHAQSVSYAELDEIFGEPVTTSVTGKPQRASESPAALVIITRDDIRRSPATDIPGLIRAYADIDVARWTEGQSDVVIRGGVQPYNPRLLVLVNGRQVYIDHYGMTNWAGLGVQIGEIQQIEVVMGPNSALFGFNAASGVINIITINPLQTQQAGVTAEIGTSGHLHLTGVAALKLATNVGLRMSGGFEKSDELAGIQASPLGSRIAVEDFPPRHGEAAAELFVTPDSATDAGVSATYSDSQGLDFVPGILGTIPQRYKFGSIGAHVSHDTGWGVVSAQAFRNWSDITTAHTVLGYANTFKNKVFAATANTLVRAGTSNILRVGIEYRANALTTSPGYPGSTHYTVLAGSGMWETHVSDAVTLTAAGRLDHLQLGQSGVVDQPSIFTKQDFDRAFTTWSFNSALLIKLSGTSSLRVAAGRGIQAPSLFSFGQRVAIAVPGSPFPIVSSGNPYINPSKVWSGEIGLVRALGKIGGQIELTAFYNRTSDLMGSDGFSGVPRAAPPTYSFIGITTENIGSYEAYGMSASVTGQLGQHWRWMANYSWIEGKEHISGGQTLNLDHATPRHKIKTQISYEGGAWLGTLGARYTSASSQLVALNPLGGTPSLFDVSDSLALDGKLAFKVSDRLTIAITGENLTKAAGADLSLAPPQRRLRASAVVRF